MSIVIHSIEPNVMHGIFYVILEQLKNSYHNYNLDAEGHIEDDTLDFIIDTSILCSTEFSYGFY